MLENNTFPRYKWSDPGPTIIIYQLPGLGLVMSVRNVLSVNRSLFITNENAILVHCTNMTRESWGKDFTNDNALKMHDRQETYNYCRIFFVSL